MMTTIVTNAMLEKQLEQRKQLNKQRKWGFATAEFPDALDVSVLNEGCLPVLATNLPDKGRQSGRQRTFEEFWDLVVPPSGYMKNRWSGLQSDAKYLRLAPGYDYRPGIYWVAFNPNAYHRLSPTSALVRSRADGVRLAGLEVLMALEQFPDWAKSWNGKTNPYPWLSGLQANVDDASTPWSDVPFLHLWDNLDGRRQLVLYQLVGLPRSHWGSPTVEEY